MANLSQPTLNWKTPSAQEPGVEHRPLVNRDGSAWTGGERAYDAETGRLVQTGLPQMVKAWGTPRASDAQKGGPNQSYGGGGIPLPAQAAQWMTPSVPNGGRGMPEGTSPTGTMPNGGKRQIGLDNQAKQWPTPAARDHKGENSPDHLTNGTGRLHMDQLPNAVAHGFTHPARPTSMRGGMPSPHARISRPLWALMTSSHGRTKSRRIWKARAKRRLNPLFVEWLMGWPYAHALCASSETAFIRWQQDMRGALSQLPTDSGPWIWMPPADSPQPEQLSLL